MGLCKLRRWVLVVGLIAGGGSFISAGGTPLSSSAPGNNPLGMNLSQVGYGTTNLPFLNIVKQSGSNYPTVNWFTTNGVGGADTGEELLLNLDSDGYPLQIPQSGLTSTAVYAIVFRSPTGTLAPSQTAYYPSGSYTVQFSGAGTVVITGDASATISTSGGTFTVSTATAGGLNINISASTLGNHLHNLSIVQTSLVASFNAGAFIHPTYLATIQNYSCFRFMDWRNTNGQLYPLSYSGTINAGATSFTLNNAWGYPTGTYTAYFNPNNNSAPQSETRSVTLTAGSTTVSWSGGLSYSYTLGYNVCADISSSWANRNLPSSVSYTLKDGVPIEICVALCNLIGANCWLNTPLTVSDSYIESWAALVINGTGAQSGYSALNSNLNFYAELSNEVWNGAFQQSGVATTLGFLMWPSQASGGGYSYNLNWYGMRCAQMASDLQTQLGSAFSRCIPVLGSQAAGSASLSTLLSAPYWTTGTGPPSSYPIKAVAMAPYWGGDPSNTDAITMLGVATPLDDFFATLTSQTGTTANGSHVYSSVPSGGWLGQAEGWISSYLSLMSSYPSMHLIGYEGGQNFYADNGVASGWASFVISAERDARMGSAYTSFLNYWAAHVGAGSANILNLLTDISTYGVGGCWGCLEDVMQQTSPLTSAPAKYQAIQNYIA